jgi:hypothetical protein
MVACGRWWSRSAPEAAPSCESTPESATYRGVGKVLQTVSGTACRARGCAVLYPCRRPPARCARRPRPPTSRGDAASAAGHHEPLSQLQF